MESAIVLSEEDVKTILAKYFHVDKSKVLKAKYSYTIIGAKTSEIMTLQTNQKS